MQRLDLTVAAAVEEPAGNTPPANPDTGACYLIGPAPTGEWAGKADHLAGYTEAGWRYVAPFSGLSVLVQPSGQIAVFRNDSWDVGTVRAASLVVDGDQVVGPRAAAISNPAGGSQADAEARTTIAAILDALRQHGLIAT